MATSTHDLTSATSSPPQLGRIERFSYGDAERPRISIVIPTRDGCRRGLLEKLLDDLHDQSIRDLEVVLVIGDPRQGRAINRGVRVARAEIVGTMDDDTVIGTPYLLEKLLRVLEEHPDVGLVGASTVLPPGCSSFQRRASRQIPRRLFPIVDELTDSDMVQHPCLATWKSVFLEIGGEDEELVRGLDPLLRHKVREAGYRVVIAPDAYISHPLPESLMSVLRMYFRNGRGSAFAQRHYPDRVFNLSDGHQRNQFPAKIPYYRRALAHPFRMVWGIITGKWIRVAVQNAYLLGYLRESISRRRPTETAH